MKSRAPAADVVLVTATGIETTAVLTEFGRGHVLVHVENETYFDLGVINGARIFLVQSELGSTGPGSSILTVTASIGNLRPSAVVMLGIAFGMDSGGQQLGQIIVARQLRDYEVQRVGRVRAVARGGRVDASPRLLKMFRAASQDWRGCPVDFGLLLSGGKVVDNVRFRDALRAFEPEALGGEMEGAGVYAAAYRERVDWIVAKAICDWADGGKKERESENQWLAVRNVAAFVRHVLEKGGFAPPGSGSKRPVRGRMVLALAILGALVTAGIGWWSLGDRQADHAPAQPSTVVHVPPGTEIALDLAGGEAAFDAPSHWLLRGEGEQGGRCDFQLLGPPSYRRHVDAASPLVHGRQAGTYEIRAGRNCRLYVRGDDEEFVKLPVHLAPTGQGSATSLFEADGGFVVTVGPGDGCGATVYRDHDGGKEGEGVGAGSSRPFQGPGRFWVETERYGCRLDVGDHARR